MLPFRTVFPSTPAAPCGPVAPVGPCGPDTPVAPCSPGGPELPCGPGGPTGPGAPAGPCDGEDAIQLVPLKVNTSPLAGAIVRSIAIPLNLSTDIFCCVPLMSPMNGPRIFHAAMDWRAGTTETLGDSGTPSTLTRSDRFACISTSS